MNGNGYEPRPKQVEILKQAMAHIKSVPYKVTPRWLFYRLFQDGLYKDKRDYKAHYIPLLSKVRKSFHDGWRPDTLADDSRELIEGARGWDSVEDFIEGLRYRSYTEDKWITQPYYIEVWFEAAAMVSQFQHYLDGIPLFPFKGDCSIAPKWEAAKRLESRYEEYDSPLVVIYFGDDDPKGLEIPKNAMANISEWCSIPIEFIRAGLNPGDGERLGLPENPDKPGSYQWEALNDEQAGAIITAAINKYYDHEAADKVRQYEHEVTEDFSEKIESFIEQWQSD